jgi:hypothetical protein
MTTASLYRRGSGILILVSVVACAGAPTPMPPCNPAQRAELLDVFADTIGTFAPKG